MENVHVVVAVDSFKGSASSVQAEEWIETGIRRVMPKAVVSKIPIADGGEGTVEALTLALNGKIIEQQVCGPLGEKVTAHFGMLDAQTAVVEMAESSGITLIEQNAENALKASTYGVGEMIAAAAAKGAKEIYLGLGGSATTDGGSGMAKALGIRFLDKQGAEIPCGAEGLQYLDHIDLSQKNPLLAEISIKILSDVTNPLTGENGATHIYGPQKGVSPENIKIVDSWLHHYSEVIERDVKKKVETLPGAGAAGGLGAGLMAFCHTEMYQGIEHILQLVGLEEQVKQADLVITGEGKMDAQSINGKAPVGIAQLAKKYGVPTIALVGSRDDDLSPVYSLGINLVLSVLNRPMSLAEAMSSAESNIITAGETAMRAYLINSK